MNAIKFGTDGLRGRVGLPPFRQSELIAFGNAITVWAAEKYARPVRILIAQDPRNSSEWVKTILKSSLLQINTVLFDADVLPTAAVCALLKYSDHYDFGIMITASHNGYADNGIKIIDKNGCKLNAADEEQIATLLNTQTNFTDHYFGKSLAAGELAALYMQLIKSFFPSDLLTGITIALDCANGAASSIAPTLFESLGARVHPIHAEPDGFNINAQCGSLHPQALQAEVIKANAKIGFAFDGDADRLLIVTSKGIIKNGDDIIALLSNHIAYKNCINVVGTTMSNQGLAYYLQAHNKLFHRAAVGDKMVAQMMLHQNALLGGEPSGHVLAADYLLNSDGIFAALRVIEAIIQNNNWDFETFEKFPQFISNIPVKVKKDITTPDLASLIEEYESYLQPGRLLIRYSGTEPVLRVMVEHQDSQQANFVLKKLESILRKYLS